MPQSNLTDLINGFGVLFVIFNAFGLGLRLPIGKLLAQASAHWKIAVWVLVINFVIIPLLFIGYLLTIASSIPGEIKVGFCVAALCAGMPFAPILARLAKADVSIATTLLVVLTAATIIALPLGLPLAIDAVDAQFSVSAWDIAWPLLLFLLLPLVLGCGFRIGWPDLTPQLARWAVRSPFCVCSSISTSRWLRIGICSWRPGHRELHRGSCQPIHRPRVWLPSCFQSSSQRRGNQACDRVDHGGTQHRSDAPHDDFPLWSRPVGHGVDHDPQHRRHRGRCAIRPDVEARCFTIEH